jgi:hypothetical protein
MAAKQENLKKGMGQKPSGGIPLPKSDKLQESVGEKPKGPIPIPKQPEQKQEEKKGK